MSGEDKAGTNAVGLTSIRSPMQLSDFLILFGSVPKVVWRINEGAEILIRYLLAWAAMLVIAIANGALRQKILAKFMSELRAHQLSTLIGSVVIGLFIWLVIRIWPPSSGRQALRIGFCWLALTIAFEFFMGLVLAHRPFALVPQDYNILAGRVWVLFLIWLTLAPWIFFHLRTHG